MEQLNQEETILLDKVKSQYEAEQDITRARVRKGNLFHKAGRIHLTDNEKQQALTAAGKKVLDNEMKLLKTRVDKVIKYHNTQENLLANAYLEKRRAENIPPSLVDAYTVSKPSGIMYDGGRRKTRSKKVKTQKRH